MKPSRQKKLSYGSGYYPGTILRTSDTAYEVQRNGEWRKIGVVERRENKHEINNSVSTTRNTTKVTT